MRKIWITWVSALALSLFSQVTLASMCLTGSPADELRNSQLLFRGTPYWVSPFSDEAYVKVEKVYKGVLSGNYVKVNYRRWGSRTGPSMSFMIGFSKVIDAYVEEGRQGQEVRANMCWDLAVAHFPAGWEDVFDRYRKQHEMLVQNVSAQPANPAGWRVLAASEIEARDWLQLKLTTNYLIKLEPNSVAAHVLRGKSLARLSQADAAMAAYRSALVLDPYSEEARKAVDQLHIDEREPELVDARRTDFSGMDLRGLDLSCRNLTGWNFSDVQAAENFEGAQMRGIKARNANLSYASLAGADLREADLVNANFSNADLRYAYLAGADLRQANLEDVESFFGATYSAQTRWPINFDPKDHEMRLVR